MGFLSRFAAIFHSPPQSVGDEGGWLVKSIKGGKTKSSVPVSERTALHLPVVYACINRIANPIASFPVKILRARKGGGAEEVTDHPLSQRLGMRPNEFMSSRTIRKTIQTHALLWGNGYVEIERNGYGQAVNLWPLLPDRTTPRRVDERLVYDTSVNGQTHRISGDNVLHIMDLSHDGYIGMSPVAMAREAIGMGLAMEQFGAAFFGNDAKSGGFLLHPGKLSALARENLGQPKEKQTGAKGDLERQGGLENAHRVKVLEEGMKYVPTTIPPEDAQFLGSREFQIAEIARIYDVPLILLQSQEKQTSFGAGIEQLMIGFVRQTIEPWIRAWEMELNWKLFTEAERASGLYVKFNMNALLRGDSAARAAFYKELFAVAGLTPNQICALEDMDPIGADGDHRFVPANFVTLRRAIDGATDAAPAANPRGVPPPPSDDDDDEEREAA